MYKTLYASTRPHQTSRRTRGGTRPSLGSRSTGARSGASSPGRRQRRCSRARGTCGDRANNIAAANAHCARVVPSRRNRQGTTRRLRGVVRTSAFRWMAAATRWLERSGRGAKGTPRSSAPLIRRRRSVRDHTSSGGLRKRRRRQTPRSSPPAPRDPRRHLLPFSPPPPPSRASRRRRRLAKPRRSRRSHCCSRARSHPSPSGLGARGLPKTPSPRAKTCAGSSRFGRCVPSPQRLRRNLTSSSFEIEPELSSSAVWDERTRAPNTTVTRPILTVPRAEDNCDSPYPHCATHRTTTVTRAVCWRGRQCILTRDATR